ncbi:MAG TPA: endonuclease III, partial [Dehalococcoidia bacterium]|nr:endonuclease III [Dehalococcoidia bacterium]
IHEIVRRLQEAHGAAPWRPHGDPTAELVLTILSQNTSDANSGRAFVRLLSRFRDWREVMEAPLPALVEAIQPGGLGPTKAPRIQAALREVYARTGGFDLSFLAKLPLEEARAWLRSLPGVGPKTAACVLLFSLGMPALPVDTHVHRVAIRLGLVPETMSAERAHEALERMVAPEDVYDFHVALIKHGRRTCTARRPKCAACPLRDLCPSADRFV